MGEIAWFRIQTDGRRTACSTATLANRARLGPPHAESGATGTKGQVRIAGRARGVARPVESMHARSLDSEVVFVYVRCALVSLARVPAAAYEPLPE